MFQVQGQPLGDKQEVNPVVYKPKAHRLTESGKKLRVVAGVCPTSMGAPDNECLAQLELDQPRVDD